MHVFSEHRVENGVGTNFSILSDMQNYKWMVTNDMLSNLKMLYETDVRSFKQPQSYEDTNPSFTFKNLLPTLAGAGHQ
jgi:hypothetical protein